MIVEEPSLSSPDCFPEAEVPSPDCDASDSVGCGDGVLVLALLYVPMIYCAFCTYFAMFRMKLCDFYALHPHHSDAGSLLFNATYACRFGPALCFNMLKLLEVHMHMHMHTCMHILSI